MVIPAKEETHAKPRTQAEYQPHDLGGQFLEHANQCKFQDEEDGKGDEQRKPHDDHSAARARFVGIVIDRWWFSHSVAAVN